MRYSQRLLYMAMLLILFIAVPGHVRSLRAAPAPARVQDPHHSDQGFAPEAATPDEHQRAMSQNMMRMMNEMKTADAKMDELVRKGATAPPGMQQLIADKGVRFVD